MRKAIKHLEKAMKKINKKSFDIDNNNTDALSKITVVRLNQISNRIEEQIEFLLETRTVYNELQD
jgi:hypothetical protein